MHDMYVMAEPVSIARRAAHPCPLVMSTERSGQLLLGLVAPVTLEVALSVQAEMQARDDEIAALREQSVQRSREAAELAKRRFMEVDPGNRLVADVSRERMEPELAGFARRRRRTRPPPRPGPDIAR